MERRFSVAVLILSATIFLLGACTARRQNSADEEFSAALRPDVTEAFTHAGLRLLNQRVAPRNFSLPVAGAEGEILTLGELTGKVVLLNFWTTWCPSCRAEMLPLESLYNRHREAGLRVVAVNLRENPEQVQAFMIDNALSFPAVLDIDGRVGSDYGVQAIPTSFIIDREGYIIARFVGRIDWGGPHVLAAFERLLH